MPGKHWNADPRGLAHQPPSDVDVWWVGINAVYFENYWNAGNAPPAYMISLSRAGRSVEPIDLEIPILELQRKPFGPAAHRLSQRDVL